MCAFIHRIHRHVRTYKSAFVTTHYLVHPRSESYSALPPPRNMRLQNCQVGLLEMLASLERLHIRFKSLVCDFMYSFGRAALLLLVQVLNQNTCGPDIAYFYQSRFFVFRIENRS
jgi:hypothetical protein